MAQIQLLCEGLPGSIDLWPCDYNKFHFVQAGPNRLLHGNTL